MLGLFGYLHTSCHHSTSSPRNECVTPSTKEYIIIPAFGERDQVISVMQAACGRENIRHPDALCPWLVTPDPSAGLSRIESSTIYCQKSCFDFIILWRKKRQWTGGYWIFIGSIFRLHHSWLAWRQAVRQQPIYSCSYCLPWPITSNQRTCQVQNTRENVSSLTYFSLPTKDKTENGCKRIKSRLWKLEHPVHVQIIKTSEGKNHLSNFLQTSVFLQKQMFTELDLGGVFDMWNHLACEDEGKQGEAGIPLGEV